MLADRTVDNMFALQSSFVVALASTTWAVTSISDDDMTRYLNNGAVDLAFMYAPMWFFGQAMDQPPCYPVWAFNGNVSTPDVYDVANPTPPAPQCEYPDVGCGCRQPDVPIGNSGPAFPIYYTFKQCNSTEVRVVYNLFYQKDGAEVVDLVDTGHDYDWERVIIVHSKNTADNTWTPSRALLSAHSGYHDLAWGDIQNTLTTDEINAGDAITPNGVQNNDHPKVYVSWSKHANFDTRNTGWNDPISQSTDDAFRSQDWWHFVEAQYYILSDSSTAAGQALGAVNWGSASSNPPSVQETLCTQQALMQAAANSS